MCVRVLFVVVLSLLVGCSHYLQPGEYRFQAWFEREATAFRNGGGPRAEPLAMAVKLQNLSTQKIYLAKAPSGGPASFVCNRDLVGLVVMPELLNAVPGIGRPTAVAGLRGGEAIFAEADAARTPIFDRHTPAVEHLAESGETLLHLNPDAVRSTLGLFGNEALVTLIFPVDWRQVPPGQAFQYVELQIQLRLAYCDPDGTLWKFSGALRRQVKSVLSNGIRYASGLEPARNGPLSGEFRR